MTKVENNIYNLAEMRTLLANQRTYLAYMRTGFAVTALAINMKSDILIVLGMSIIFIGLYQYYSVSKSVREKKIEYNSRDINIVLALVGVLAVFYYYYKTLFTKN